MDVLISKNVRVKRMSYFRQMLRASLIDALRMGDHEFSRGVDTSNYMYYIPEEYRKALTTLELSLLEMAKVMSMINKDCLKNATQLRELLYRSHYADDNLRDRDGIININHPCMQLERLVRREDMKLWNSVRKLAIMPSTGAVTPSLFDLNKNRIDKPIRNWRRMLYLVDSNGKFYPDCRRGTKKEYDNFLKYNRGWQKHRDSTQMQLLFGDEIEDQIYYIGKGMLIPFNGRSLDDFDEVKKFWSGFMTENWNARNSPEGNSKMTDLNYLLRSENKRFLNRRDYTNQKKKYLLEQVGRMQYLDHEYVRNFNHWSRKELQIRKELMAFEKDYSRPKRESHYRIEKGYQNSCDQLILRDHTNLPESFSELPKWLRIDDPYEAIEMYHNSGRTIRAPVELRSARRLTFKRKRTNG